MWDTVSKEGKKDAQHAGIFPFVLSRSFATFCIVCWGFLHDNTSNFKTIYVFKRGKYRGAAREREEKFSLENGEPVNSS